MRPIDADALIEAMGEEPYVWTDSADEIAERNQWLTDMHIIESAPTIDVVPKDFHDKTCEAMAKRHTEEIQKLMRLMPKRGEWLPDENGDFRCTNCGRKAEWEFFEDNFCPNCGADMREREGE